ncbi:hypothetical protein SAMN05444354_113182 [Stigmatella aurantiaca]|uniref:Lipoprotein n=1 Tax=Stigmatella aurantiaca TaxID=41 RepID=A0A1H7WTQ5_STIAU|nr:hypothetical protein [Stigmatella aurantiaca]SEM24695.1 hypothetical protein SAMN05444354_113182 [Stigmatella aurantiaca]
MFPRCLPLLLRASPVLCLLLSVSCRDTSEPLPSPEGEVLAFDISEANVRNSFFRQGPVAAHQLTTSGMAPRVVWGFPAENTGIGVWFYPPAQPTELVVEGAMEPVQLANGLWGVRSVLTSDAPLLRIKKAVLGNVRNVRDYFYGATLPPEFDYTLQQEARASTLSFNALDGKHHIQLRLEYQEGTTGAVEGSQLVFRAGPSGQIRLRTTALIDYTPLTPIPLNELVTAGAANNPEALNALAFLSYREKLLAGSWRFLTYFGRDTLLSLRMLMPVLQPAVMEAGLGAVIDRLGPEGAVAHEEALGDYAWVVRTGNQEPPPPPPGDMFSPWLDYKMVDSDFILPAVLAAYAASPAGQGHIQEFLARKTPSGESYQSAVERNIALVVRKARPFSQNPIAAHLVAITHPEVGNWRDSGAGLGFGTYPFDVNASLVPAALRGAASLYAAGLLGAGTERAAALNAMAEVWETHAAGFFQVDVDLPTAQERVRSYASRVGLEAAPALASLTGPVTYRAVSLDRLGNPVPVMNTDDGFLMLFNTPPEAFLTEAAGRILRPFPAGLRTGSGIVVASTALAEPGSSLHSTFTRGDYHGTVIWSWQQAMLAAGLERQLTRTDLSPGTVTTLRAAQTALWQVIQSASALNTGELWSWVPRNGQAQYASFAEAAIAEDRFVDESNAAQLWSTVYLAVQPPQ